jgi:hypothetical protein
MPWKRSQLMVVDQYDPVFSPGVCRPLALALTAMRKHPSIFERASWRWGTGWI